MIARLAPAAIAVEQAFVAKDPSAALKLGHARAVALLARRKRGWRLPNMPPTISRSLWSAPVTPARTRCNSWFKRLLPTCGVTQADAADALACAIAHAHLSSTRTRIVIAETRTRAFSDRKRA